METITISAKYNNGRLIPLEPLPKGVDFDAIIILMRPEKKTKQNPVNIKPLSMGNIKSDLSRKELYNEKK